MKLAAIDIGSNAARLLIAEVAEWNEGKISTNKLELIRVPLRLGFDAFELGMIRNEKRKMVIDTMLAFKYMMRAYDVSAYKACATSAMRDSVNGAALIEEIKIKSGIEIQLISGSEEAQLVYENHTAENLNPDHAYLYIDVGGGSTEVTFFADGALVYKQSFNIGTIRILKQKVSLYDWEEMKAVVKTYVNSKKEIKAIGSGGNINKVFSLSKKKDGKPLSLQLLQDYYKELSSATIEQRIKLYKLKEDRADVIVPALQIYINLMRWADIDEIFVPKIGVADGLIKKLYMEIKKA